MSVRGILASVVAIWRVCRMTMSVTVSHLGDPRIHPLYESYLVFSVRNISFVIYFYLSSFALHLKVANPEPYICFSGDPPSSPFFMYIVL